jgi:hypothetical protein
MNDSYGSTGYDMTDTWHCFGDPSMVVRTAQPQTMTVTHITFSPVGIHDLVVSCTLDDALVALTNNGNLIGTGVVAGGSATISFATIMQPDTIDVTVTGFNQAPYEGEVIIYSATGLNETEAGPVAVWTDAAAMLHIQSDLALNTVTLFNEAGQIVQATLQRIGHGKVTLDLHRLAPGAYVAEVQTAAGAFRKGFVVR